MPRPIRPRPMKPILCMLASLSAMRRPGSRSSSPPRNHFLVADLSLKPEPRGVHEDGAPHGEAFAYRVARRSREAALELVLAGLHAEQQYAPAIRVVLRNSPFRRPIALHCGRSELPPVGLDAGGVDLRERRVLHHELDQELAAGGDAGFMERLEPGNILGRRQRKALHDVLGGPRAQRRRDVVARLEAQRPAAGQLDRAREPHSLPGEREERFFAVALVDDGSRHGKTLKCSCDRPLEVPDPLGRAELLELLAVIEGEGEHFRPGAPAGCLAVRFLEQRRFAQPERPVAVREEELELGAGRHRRRAAVARDHERAAGVGAARAFLERLAFQPAGQEAREAVSRPRILNTSTVKPVDSIVCFPW